MDYKQLAEELVRKCVAGGADQAEVYLEANRELNVAVRKGEVETVEESSTHGVGFRVFVKGKMAFSSCNDFSDASLKETIGFALEFAKHTSSDEHNVLPGNDSGDADVPGMYDESIRTVPMAEKVNLAKNLEKAAMKDPRINKSDGSSYREGDYEIVIANSNGIKKYQKGAFCGISVTVVAEKGEQKTTGSEGCFRRYYKDIKPVPEIASKAAKDALDMLDARMVKTQQAPVIFHPDAAYSVLGGILAAVNGERVLQGASFLGKRLNSAIASPLMTLVDDGRLPKGLSSTPFDGEGVATQKRLIVEKGKLLGFLYNTQSAHRAGTKSTGNASRGGYASLPGIGAHNFYMTAGDTPAGEIIGATKTGLLVKEVTGYGINPVSGDFSGGVSGFWIEDGKIAFPVQGLTIAGSADEMLNAIDMVGDDLDLNRGLAAPTFRIKLMQIGGE